jgi:sensor histidine kinase YesM
MMSFLAYIAGFFMNFELLPILTDYALKQQWTIKISSPFFLFLAWRPSWLEVTINGHNFGRGPSKNHFSKIWLILDELFSIYCRIFYEL